MQDVAFKPQAYSRAARFIEPMEEDLEEVYKEGGLKALMEVEGIGQGLAEKIEEYIKTGKIEEYEKQKKECPVDLEALAGIEGLGPKMIKTLYEKLGIKTLKDLEKAAKTGKIHDLPRFGKKVEQNILRGIEFSKSGQGRFTLGMILPIARRFEQRLGELDSISQAIAAGSIRRMKETVGDIDILVISNNSSKVMDYFCSMAEVEKIIAKGETKSSVRLDLGLDADIRVVPKESFGAALQYFTGSKDHNISLRKIAQGKGLKLNEYGVFSAKGGSASGGKGKKQIAGKTEEEVYKALGLEYVPPELRENTGEIEAAFLRQRADQGKRDGLPRLIELEDIKGDLHCHSDWDGGENSISEMAQAAGNMSYQYIGISDHTKFLRIENGLDEKQIARRNKEIDKLNAKFKNFRILKGVEANILNDGTIDIEDETLASLDYVIAGIHSTFKMKKGEMTERMIRAMKNPHVDIISHPTGRLIGRRDEYQLDFEKILKVAKETGTVLEINSYPDRLDLNDRNIRRAKEAGVRMIINTDSHHRAQLGLMEYGVAQARRGWAEKKDIINTMGYEELIKFLKTHKK